MSEGFEAEARREGAVAVIDLRGRVDSGADQALGAAYREATADGVGAVLMNFAGVDYINSTGIAVIVGLLAQARGTGVEMRACGLTEHYREIFEITRLADFMEIFPDEAAAVAGTAEPAGT